MFNRPKPNGDSPKRSPFTDLQNISQDEAKESKGLDNFDWNRKLNLKKTEKAHPMKKKFVVKVAEEKGNDENFSPNSRTAYSAFGKNKKTSPSSSSVSSRASRRGECKDSEDLTDEDNSISYEESSPRFESKDVQHENLLRLAHALSPSQSQAQDSTTPNSLKGPPADMISPIPSSLRNRGSMLVGSPLLNVTKREVELSPQTPDMSVSPSQQVTPPHRLDDDYSDSKSTCTSKEEKSVCSDNYQRSYDEHGYTYDNQEHYDESDHQYENGNDEDYHQQVEFQITNQEYYSDSYYQEVAEDKHTAAEEEIYTAPTSLQALTPVKLKSSMTVKVIEHVAVAEEKSVVDSPDSTSSGVTNLSTELEVEQLFSKVRHNRIDDVKKMLDGGTNTRIKDSNGNSLLHICAQNNLKKMATLVLDYGADINAENKKGTTALDYCDNYHFDKLGDWFVQNGGDNGHANLRIPV